MYTKYDMKGEGWKWGAGMGGRVAEVLKVPRLEASTPAFEVVIHRINNNKQSVNSSK